LRYEEGGKFEVHRDTYCYPLEDCDTTKVSNLPRLMTYLIYLNQNYQESDGGEFVIY